MNKVQVFLIVFAIIITIVGVIIFSRTSSPESNLGETSGSLTLWGTLPQSSIGRIFVDYRSETNIRVNYSQKDPRTFDKEILDALASGTGPDLLIADIHWFESNKNKLQSGPLSLLPETFENEFIDVATDAFMEEIVADDRKTLQTHIWAMPLWIDPLVMYWNKDLFNTSGVSLPPKDWAQLKSASNKIKIVEQGGLVERAGVTIGRSENVHNFKQILALMTRQQGKELEEVFLRKFIGQFSEEESIVRLYTDFGRISSPTYTWNASLPNSRDAFANGAAGILFDNYSYEPELQARNPHLSFNIAPVPQVENAGAPVYVGTVTGVGVPLTSENKLAAWNFARWLASKSVVTKLLENVHASPVRRDMLVGEDTPAFLRDIVLNSKHIVDTHPVESNAALKEAIESITNGRQTISEAMRDARFKFLNSIGELR